MLFVFPFGSLGLASALSAAAESAAQSWTVGSCHSPSNVCEICPSAKAASLLRLYLTFVILGSMGVGPQTSV